MAVWSKLSYSHNLWQIAHFHSISLPTIKNHVHQRLLIVYIYLFVINSLFIIAISFIFTLIDQFGIVDNLSRKHRIWRRLFVHVLGYQVFLISSRHRHWSMQANNQVKHVSH